MEDLKLEILRAGDGVLEVVDLGEDEWGDGKVGNVARLYEAFAEGIDEKEQKMVWWPDFEHALETHGVIEQMYKENGFRV